MTSMHDDNSKPWLMPLVNWCEQTGSDKATYDRLVKVAFRGGAFHPQDEGVSEDARWLATICRNFESHRTY